MKDHLRLNFLELDLDADLDADQLDLWTEKLDELSLLPPASKAALADEASGRAQRSRAGFGDPNPDDGSEGDVFEELDGSPNYVKGGIFVTKNTNTTGTTSDSKDVFPAGTPKRGVYDRHHSANASVKRCAEGRRRYDKMQGRLLVGRQRGHQGTATARARGTFQN